MKTPSLNLIPFVDLFTTLICFCLITTAWQQLGVVSTTAQTATTLAGSSTGPTLTVSLMNDRIELAEGRRVETLPNVAGQPDLPKMKATLKDWKKRYPEKHDVVLAADNRAKYKSLVLMMDALIAQDFSDVGLNLN